MALRDHLPVIDDRRYTDIVAEARTRIPRYTPEWTDLNENEPGMAIVELFGWMSELLIYRLGKVPQLNYLKFLELLGIELTPARPATVELAFPMLPTFAEPYVLVPRHTQVGAEVPGEDQPVVFETERALVALAARLDIVQSDNGFEISDLSALDAGAEAGYRPFGATPRIGSALLLGFDSTLDFPAVPIDLMVWLTTRRRRGPLIVQAGLAMPPPVTLRWEAWDGKTWRHLDTLQDDTAGFTRSGHVVLAAPAKHLLQRDRMGKLTAQRYWLRVRLISGDYQIAPTILAIRTNTVTALQAESVDAEILGRSDGRPNQAYSLGNTPVIDATLAVEVDEGEGFVPWREVGDFFASGPDDTHYALNRTTGEVRFGDGRNGHIPVANPNRPANLVARRYRFGGGARGNVARGLVSSLRGAVGGIDAGRIANLFAAYGGANEETFDAVKARAAQSLKSNERAVTAGDFELHAIAAGGVARARALPLHHPGFPDLPIPGTVSVIVLPLPDAPDDPAPMPTEGTLRHVCAALDARRLATTELFAIAPRYREIIVTATLIVADDADLGQVKQAALSSLQRYFHPLTGGEDSTTEAPGSGWPFGGSVHYSLVMRRLLLDGVRRVHELAFTLDGETIEPCRDAAVAADVLLRSGAHDISVRYESVA